MAFFGRIFRQGGLNHYRRGIVLYNQRAYEEAADAFERAIGEIQDPSNPYHNLGLFYIAEARAKLGRSLLQQDRRDEAASQFQRALEAGYQYPDLHYLLGRIFEDMDALPDARAQYEMALQINPGYAEARVHLIAVLWRGEPTGSFDEHLQVLQKNGFALPPDLRCDTQDTLTEEQVQHLLDQTRRREESLDHAQRAVDAYDSGDASTAIAEMRAAVEERPGYADLRCRLGILLAEKGEIEDARAQFAHAIEINPMYVDARLQCGILELRNGRAENALAHLEVAVEGQPDYPESRLFLALAQLRLARLDDCGHTLRDLQEAHPSFRSATFLEGCRVQLIDDAVLTGRAAAASVQDWGLHREATLQRLEDPSAQGSYREARTREASASSLRSLGLALLVRGRAAEAEDPLRRAVAAASDDAWARLALARTLLALGHPSAARHELEPAVANAAAGVVLRLWWGRCCWSEGRRDEAISLWREGIPCANGDATLGERAASTDPFLDYVLGVAYLHQRQAEHARRAFARVLQDDPYHSTARVIADDAWVESL